MAHDEFQRNGRKQMAEVRTDGSGYALHMVGFAVGKEEFCVDILKVQEIIRMMEITPVPSAPDFVEGVINLRGKVIPVVDFRKRFRIIDGDAPIDITQQRIIVMALGEVTVGIVVDRVSQVLKLTPDQISPTPEVSRGVDNDCINGVGRVGEQLKIILDLDRLFTKQFQLEYFGSQS